jgi:predicted TIM-barrel fold metal-dependent hydrolase
LEIVDSQIHFWDGLKSAADAHRGERLTEVELLPRMDDAGVRRAVLVPGEWGADENQAALKAASAYPGRFAVMGHLHAVQDAEAKGTLASFTSPPGMMGIRLALRREPYATYFASGAIDWFWPEAAEIGLQVMVYAPGQIDRIGEIARQYPTLRLIVDHMGVNPADDDAARSSQLAQAVSVASEPNVAVKLSALPLYSREQYPFKDVWELIHPLVAAFGAHRCFWGSDLTRLKSYPEAVRMMTGATTELEPDQLNLIMGQALLDWFGWK